MPRYRIRPKRLKRRAKTLKPSADCHDAQCAVIKNFMAKLKVKLKKKSLKVNGKHVPGKYVPPFKSNMKYIELLLLQQTLDLLRGKLGVTTPAKELEVRKEQEKKLDFPPGLENEVPIKSISSDDRVMRYNQANNRFVDVQTDALNRAADIYDSETATQDAFNQLAAESKRAELEQKNRASKERILSEKKDRARRNANVASSPFFNQGVTPLRQPSQPPQPLPIQAQTPSQTPLQTPQPDRRREAIEQKGSTSPVVMELDPFDDEDKDPFQSMSDFTHQGSGEKLNKGLYSEQIDHLMKDYPNYLGCYASDELDSLLDAIIENEMTQFGAIVNLDKSTLPGSHWVALYGDLINEKEVNYYDSLAGERFPPFIRNFFLRLITRMDIPYMLKLKKNECRDQRINSNTCGLHAVEFLQGRLNGKPFRECSGYDILKQEAHVKKKFGYI